MTKPGVAATLLLCLFAVHFVFELKRSPRIVLTLHAGSFSLQSLPEEADERSSTERPFKATKQYNFTVSMCSITKDHEAYLTEWIDYHLLAAGFDRLHLIDNSPNHDLKQWYQNTRNHTVYKRVTVDHKPGKVQQEATTDCVKKYSANKWKPPNNQSLYFGLFDTDEFVVFPPATSPYTDVHDMLQDYLVPFGGALSINCQFFGTANRSIYSPQPVLKRFQYRDNQTHPMIKVFVQANHLLKMRNPHSVLLINESLQTHTTTYPGSVMTWSNTNHQRAADGQKPDRIAILHHYRFFSQKEYHTKVCVRGRFGSDKGWCDKVETTDAKTTTKADTPDLQPIPPHAILRPGEVYDDSAWKILTEHVPKYRFFDNPEWEDYS